MKHENSNASTATTSSAGTPPTPEINGNIPGHNNNYNYQHQLQQVPQMPSQPLVQDINAQHHMQHQQMLPVQSPNTWDPPITVSQQQMNYTPPNEVVTVTPIPQQTPEIVQNSEYVNYAVNEQYSNKFEQVTTTPPVVTPALNSYDNWVSFVLKIDNHIIQRLFSFRITSNSPRIRHGTITNSSITKCNNCTPTSHHNHNQMTGTMIPTSNISKRHTPCTTTHTITIKLITIALIINNQHQLTIIQARTQRCTITALIIITLKTQRIHMLSLHRLNSNNIK